jgi:hydrogenase nickel incorporation protein HypA/HybF
VHELALTESIVTMIESRLGTARVVRVRLEVGRLTAVLPEALRFAFVACTEGTPLEGAKLEIDELCGSELRIKEVEVA